MAGFLASSFSVIASSAGGTPGSTWRGGVRRVVHVLVGDGHRVVAGEGRPAADHLVEHDAERVEVAAGIDGEALRLLGREVGGGAHDRAGLGQVCSVARAHGPGDAEVGDLHLRPAG